MGVSGLIALLRAKAPQAFSPIGVEDLRGARVGIDLSMTLYRGAALASRNGPHAYLEAMLREARWLLRLGCTPVYVVDGTAPAEKEEESSKRKALRAANEEKLRSYLEQAHRKDSGESSASAEAVPSRAAPAASEDEVLDKLQRQCIQMTAEMRATAWALLRSLGLQVVQATQEAEHTLADMQNDGEVDLIFTEDVDCILCGAKSYIKNASQLMYETNFDGSEKKKHAEKVSLEGALSGLGLTQRGLVLLGVFAGCDFAPKLKGYGPATALKLVRTAGQDLDACFARLPAESQSLKERYQRAVDLFLEKSTCTWLGKSPSSRVEAEELLEKLATQGQVATLKLLIEDVLSAEAPKRRRLE